MIIEFLQFKHLFLAFVLPLIFSIIMVLDLILVILFFNLEGAAQTNQESRKESILEVMGDALDDVVSTPVESLDEEDRDENEPAEGFFLE